MELIKRRVHMNKCNCRNRVQITLSSDFNVPDAKADALSLIKEKGEVELEDIRLVSGKCTVKGKMRFAILYLGDEKGHPVWDLSGNIPFEEIVNLEDACQNDDISVNYTIDDLQTELINSRKIGVKAIVSLELVAEALTDGEGAIDLEADECVMTRKHMIPITQMSICKKDTYRYREEWALPASKLPISKVFYEDIPLGSIKGNIPFEQLVEIPGILPDSMTVLESTIDQISTNMLGDGEIEVKTVVSLDVIAFDLVTLPMISDYMEEALDKGLRNKAPGLIGYVVKEGESLWDIAKQYYTTIADVMELNDLEQEEVNVGEMLLLAK